MKVLWVNTNFMHPTTKGGQIRTLEMLRHLNRWHEIHYVAIENPAYPEGPARAHEYSTKSYAFTYKIPDKRSASLLDRTNARTGFADARGRGALPSSGHARVSGRH